MFLYTSGEESVSQLKRRADRIGVASKRLYLLGETDVDAILHHADPDEPCGADCRLDTDGGAGGV